VRTKVCDHDACQALHSATLEVLEKTGVEVKHARALELLGGAGARIDGTRVRIPATMVEEALAAAPKEISLCRRPTGRAADTPASADHLVTLHAGATLYGTGSDCLYLLGPGTRDRRPVHLQDVEEMAMLQERLADIDFVMSMAHPGELDPSLFDAAQFAAMLRGTSKPLLMVPQDADALGVMKEMAVVCGAADSWGIYAMPTPPLVHGFESADRLIRCAELGIPMAYATALLPGATAPASRAGFIVVGNAEILSGLVIAQLAAPGAPYVYGVTQGSMNLRTSHVLYCAPESYAIQQACVDLATFYGLPSFGYGGVSDSPLLDEQWALEAGMTLLANAMSGVTLLHDLGYAGSGTASSFEAVVLMDEMVRWVKAYLDGITIDTGMLAVDEIDAVGPGGTHLSRKFTRRHYREWLAPALLSQQPYEAWDSAGGSTLLEREAVRTAELREAPRLHRLDETQSNELERLVERAGSIRTAT
jgi:trimethylamine--corrinoid protein Co-methyltransferase